MSGERLAIKVDQVLEYAQNVRSAVNFIYTHNNISESDIRFAHPDLDSAYGDYTALNSEQMVFDPSGGGIDYKPAPTGINDGTDWFFTGASCVSGVGTGIGSCTVSEMDIIAYLPNVTLDACIAINKKLGFNAPSGTPPQDNASSYDPTIRHFNGTFTSNWILRDFGDIVTGNIAGCYEGDDTPAGGTYHFYQVLLER